MVFFRFNKKVGNGSGTLFWTEPWVGTTSVATSFSRLFSISSQKEASVDQMGTWIRDQWSWNFLWRKELFVWENGLLAALMLVLSGCSFSINREMCLDCCGIKVYL